MKLEINILLSIALYPIQVYCKCECGTYDRERVTPVTWVPTQTPEYSDGAHGSNSRIFLASI